MGRKTNFLPFARRQVVSVPAAGGGKAAVWPGRISTGIGQMATGGVKVAHLQDAVVFVGTDEREGTWTRYLRTRIGIYGRQYLTEETYDIRMYQDGHRPLSSVWKWDQPYYIFPGDKIYAEIGPSFRSGVLTRSIMFNGRRLKDNVPIMLYDQRRGATGVTEPIMLGLGQGGGSEMVCPADSPVELWSVTLPENSFEPNESSELMIYDANNRYFWDDVRYQHIVDPPVPPIKLGRDWKLSPTETLTFEFENPSDAAENVTIIVRGMLEVEDRRMIHPQWKEYFDGR